MSQAASAPALPSDLLHGLALRPPVAAWDGLRYRGSVPLHARLQDAQAMAGVVASVQRGHFLGVVAVAPVHARQAAASLAPAWDNRQEAKAASVPLLADKADLPDSGRYIWRMAGAMSCEGVARTAVWCLDGHASIWLPPCDADVRQMISRELAALLQCTESALRLFSLPAPAAGTPHALDLMDAAADAALLSQAVGRPVSVACDAWAAGTADSRELVLRVDVQPSQGFASDTQAQLHVVNTSPQPDLLQSDTPWAVRPSMARLLSQPELARAAALATVLDAGEVHERKLAASLRHAGVDDLNAAQVFARESRWHEQALDQGRDPVQWRLQHLPEGPVRDLAQQVAERAQASQQAPSYQGADGRLLGRGFATAQLQTLDAQGADLHAWSAWVAEVAVHPQTGEIEVTRVVAGHDSRTLQAAQAARTRPEIFQQDPQLLADARRLLGTAPAFDDWAGSAAAAGKPGSDLAQHAPGDVAVIRQGSLALDGVATLPAAAAIANAIHHATGVRLREVPFQPEQLRLALVGEGAGKPSIAGSGRGRGWGWLAAGAAGLAGMAAMAWPLKPALPLTEGPDVSLYSPQALERGRLVAAAGDCVVCHTAPGGAANAGGFGLETPFGTIYSTNITPDNETGIGRWSYAAFERAMRHGIHQDGRQLYPAFPYTAFAKFSDGDLQALYGYLMSQPAVKAKAPETKLAFPYNLRPAMAGWNLLFHDATPFKADPARSAEWNRGAYLVEGAGHCAACHSPRNALGAEKTGIHYLSGGEAEGWSAPALNQLAGGKLPWRRDELYQYLRTGFSARHGVAAGPMAPVIHGLAELPEADVRAMVTYLMELPGQAPQAAHEIPVQAQAKVQDAPARVLERHINGERIYQNACAVCHEAGSGPTLFGVKPLLGLNTNLHAAAPDNLVQVILNGIQTPANDALGYMPGFRDSLDDRQIADLLGYLRERFAPEEKAWPDDTTTISRLRAQVHAHPE
ncbi:c-type cytochrome [Comamonas resistens]|uniref:C-type cytochrome n=1 Tax=Comamonas resistens TaxID=3046670 RepID=A0ABY8STT5_9BURK|nr:c-type cytochrome [Comamonas resistens]MDL5037073.1 c-type cytochrome [Comamonas resistens]WHS65724.1 c-type cytochrome [Comamonas resistens]